MRPDLRFPFIAGSAALVLLGVMFSHKLFDTDFGGQIIMGILVGAVASVVLYAVMRAVGDGQDKK